MQRLECFFQSLIIEWAILSNLSHLSHFLPVFDSLGLNGLAKTKQKAKYSIVAKLRKSKKFCYQLDLMINAYFFSRNH